MKLIRKLIVGISTIGLLIMTFVSATYAWFEINSRASIENFHFEVHGGQGFQVSIDNVKYTSDLKLDQLQKVMLVEYGAGKYRLATDGSQKLYEIGYDEFDNEVVSEMSQESINTAVSKYIKLLPVTSMNGRDMTDLYSSPSYASTGRFVQFSIYFKTQSDRVQDNVSYQIYLSGEEQTNDDNIVVEPTRITSEKTVVGLDANMVATINENGSKHIKQLIRVSGGQRDSIDVYSSNALRLSTTESTKEEYLMVDENNEPILDGEGNQKKGIRYVANESSTKIYELNDTENKNTDLGSYATDYTGGKSEGELDSMIGQTDPLEDELLALYCAKFNAMYTYYNNLKPDAKLTDRLLSYSNKPATITNLSNHDVITTVTSGEEAKLITFRVWLEGWDADCFDGLSKAVKIRLAFGSKRVDY